MTTIVLAEVRSVGYEFLEQSVGLLRPGLGYQMQISITNQMIPGDPLGRTLYLAIFTGVLDTITAEQFGMTEMVAAQLNSRMTPTSEGGPVNAINLPGY